VDALEALAGGLAGWLPPSWREVEENAAVEIWLSIDGPRAVCGLRLSDRTMRHRTYKQEHRPASLRPTIAAAMVRLAEMEAGQVLVDPMCGAGTILAEALSLARPRCPGSFQVWGGDRDRAAVRAAASNLRRLGQTSLSSWDATQLPLANAAVDRIVSNPPFGKQLKPEETIGTLYQRMLMEYNRILRPEGRAVLLVSDYPHLRQAARAVRWNLLQQLKVRVLGQPGVISVWRKPS
jgi:23S rRNA G2445 N2-methylase RlmL